MQIQFPPSSIWDPVIPVLISVHVTYLDIKPPPPNQYFWWLNTSLALSFQLQQGTNWWGRAAGDRVDPKSGSSIQKKISCSQSPPGHRTGQPPKVSSSLSVSLFLCHKSQHKVRFLSGSGVVRVAPLLGRTAPENPNSNSKVSLHSCHPAH